MAHNAVDLVAVADALRRNNMEVFCVDTSADVVPLLKTLIKAGDTVAVGGSRSLDECEVFPLLRNGDYRFLDRRQPGLSAEQLRDIFIQSFGADVYLCSANAVTERGEIYCVDGNSNRVSAILFGPKQVICSCGYNKIVKDLDEAVTRLKTVAAPKNTKRLNCDTYCAKEGECLATGADASYMCDGCKSDGRICCNYVVSARQRHKDRLKVIFVGEELGY